MFSSHRHRPVGVGADEAGVKRDELQLQEGGRRQRGVKLLGNLSETNQGHGEPTESLTSVF